MTLHFTLLCDTFALHVGDRLLTTGTAGGAQPWDDSANKTLMIDCGPTRMIISYAGLAHIGRTPTDQWLAERILGFRLEPAPGGGLPTRFGDINFHGGDVRKAITDLFTKAFPGQPERYRRLGLELIVSGFAAEHVRGDQYLMRPFTETHTHSGFRGGYKVTKSPRFWRWNAGHATALGVDITGELGGRVIERVLEDRTLEGIEQIFGAAIRERAAEADGDVVGTDCMSVAWIRGTGEGRVRYMRDIARPGLTMPHTYAPWVITRYKVVPPTVFAGWEGTWEHRDKNDQTIPGQRITIEALPRGKSAPYWGSFGQRRPVP